MIIYLKKCRNPLLSRPSSSMLLQKKIARWSTIEYLPRFNCAKVDHRKRSWLPPPREAAAFRKTGFALTHLNLERTITLMSWIQSTAGGCVVNVRVIPRASKNQIHGMLGDALKIRLQAPPMDGKANDALVRFLAEILKLPARNISLLSGQTGRNKRVLLGGMDAAAVCAHLKITGPGQEP